MNLFFNRESKITVPQLSKICHCYSRQQQHQQQKETINSKEDNNSRTPGKLTAAKAR
jgi:hypothetical protein